MKISDMERVEEKIDAIMKHLGIGVKPERSVREIERIVDNKLLMIQKRLERRKNVDSAKRS
ncbi:MAG: hypothetical protein GY874_19520 [Desulfobacteraceae bacterium]|nr:hypothetical protein [Desulfobacteraceae bacterium]